MASAPETSVPLLLLVPSLKWGHFRPRLSLIGCEFTQLLGINCKVRTIGSPGTEGVDALVGRTEGMCMWGYGVESPGIETFFPGLSGTFLKWL